MSSSQSTVFLCLVFALAGAGARPPRPHIIMFVIDDLGWNDVSYHGAEFDTPNIDRLAMNGVRLSQYYVNRVCSPTRSSLMAGRYAYNMAMDGFVIANGQVYSLPLNHSTIGDVLHEGGYSTHAIGKWNLGMYSWNCTPTYRGFDTFYGYYNSAEEYFNHTCGVHFPGRESRMRNNVIKALDFRNNTSPDWNENGVYSTTTFSAEAERLIMQHDVNKPFFLYHAYQAVHGPLEAPQNYIDMCSHIERQNRRTFCGMVKALDEGIGNITKRLEERGMMNDTLIVFTTDNGGQNQAGGNNWPLRGNKATLWEGGVRGVGFLHGGVLKTSGHTYDGLLHASDWLPTLAEGVAGLKLNASGNLQPLDGINAWDAIKTNTSSPRHEVLISLNPGRGPPEGHPKWSSFIGSAAIRVDNWKLIVGLPNCSLDVWPSLNVTKDKCPSGWVHPNGEEVPPPANPSLTWLFDLDQDPLEKNDLHDQHPDVVEKLRARIEEFNSTHIIQAPGPPIDPAANPTKFGNVWTPWIKSD